MTPSALLDLVKGGLSVLPELAGWTVFAHTAQYPADRQIDMTLGPAPVGAVHHGEDWLTERLIVRLSRAASTFQQIGEAHRDLLNLRDPVSKAVLNVLGNHNQLMLYPEGQRPQWDEVGITTASANDPKPYLVLELEIPLERYMGA